MIEEGTKPIIQGIIKNIIVRVVSGIIPTGAIQQRDGSYILDRAGNYIEVRA